MRVLLVVTLIIIIIGCISRQTIIINSPDTEVSDSDGLLQIEQQEGKDEKVISNRPNRDSKRPIIDKLREKKSQSR